MGWGKIGANSRPVSKADREDAGCLVVTQMEALLQPLKGLVLPPHLAASFDTLALRDLNRRKSVCPTSAVCNSTPFIVVYAFDDSVPLLLVIGMILFSKGRSPSASF
jgi:hypothetical protein